MKRIFIVPSSMTGHTAEVRLLIVEDDDALAAVVQRGLREEGYGVDVCGTARDAEHCLVENSYDLVIFDVGLPDGSGLDLCRWLRAEQKSVPVLMLTARDGLSDKVAGLDAGADDYLTKPFDFPELAARARALLRRAPNAAAPVLEVGDIRLDSASRTVWRGAITVPLTAREFSLLDYLMRNAGLVVSRELLIDHVWDANYDGISNVVDVHVANLRRKLALPGQPDVIHTVRGAGYLLGLAEFES